MLGLFQEFKCEKHGQKYHDYMYMTDQCYVSISTIHVAVATECSDANQLTREERFFLLLELNCFLRFIDNFKRLLTFQNNNDNS